MFVVFSALSTGLDMKTLSSYLPEGMQEHLTGEGSSTIVHLQLTLATTEVVGPARVALTLALTPRVAEFLRGRDTGRNLEAFCIRRARSAARAALSLSSRFTREAAEDLTKLVP